MKSLFFRFYLLIIITFVGLGWSIDKFYSSLTSQQQITSDLALHKGTFMLLNAELVRHPKAQQKDHLIALSTSFGYDIHLLEPDELSALPGLAQSPLNHTQLEYLHSGGIVTLFNDLEGKSWFFKKLTDSQYIIVLGPIYTESFAQSDIAYTVIFFIGVAFFVFLWVWPISKGLMSLTKAATAFGKGDFSARADRRVSSSLLSLVERFNAMAGRIQRLIKSHKELSHAVSHELRTPIARIRFAMEIVREEQDQQFREHYLDTMDESIEELDALVDELLVYARFDREEPQLSLVNQDMIAFLDEIINKFTLTEPKFDFILDTSTLDTNQLVMVFDKEGINKVIDNLLRNAVRYAKHNIVVQVTIETGRVFIAIEDDGVGIPESNWQTIFEPFVRLDESRDRKSGGIGLGLAIVKRFVELHHGDIDISRSKMGGARFTMSLPLN